MSESKMYETSFKSDGRTIKVTQERSVRRWQTMVSSTGALQEVPVDIHDEMREEEYRLTRPMPDGSSPLVRDHITNDPSHPVLPIATYDAAGNRQWKGKGEPDNKMVHVDPAFFSMLEQMRLAQKGKEHAARAAAPQNQERQDLAASAAVAATAALKAMQAEQAAEKSTAKK